MMSHSADGSEANKNLLGLEKGGRGARPEIKTGDQDRGSVVRVSCVRTQEAKDAVVESSVLVIVDCGDATVPANNISNQRP